MRKLSKWLYLHHIPWGSTVNGSYYFLTIATDGILEILTLTNAILLLSFLQSTFLTNIKSVKILLKSRMVMA